VRQRLPLGMWRRSELHHALRLLEASGASSAKSESSTPSTTGKPPASRQFAALRQS
jgi:hypothetical protein